MINIKIIIQKSCVTKNGGGHRTCIKCEAIDLDSACATDENQNNSSEMYNVRKNYTPANHFNSSSWEFWTTAH